MIKLEDLVSLINILFDLEKIGINKYKPPIDEEFIITDQYEKCFLAGSPVATTIMTKKTSQTLPPNSYVVLDIYWSTLPNLNNQSRLFCASQHSVDVPISYDESCQEFIEDYIFDEANDQKLTAPDYMKNHFGLNIVLERMSTLTFLKLDTNLPDDPKYICQKGYVSTLLFSLREDLKRAVRQFLDELTLFGDWFEDRSMTTDCSGLFYYMARQLHLHHGYEVEEVCEKIKGLFESFPNDGSRTKRNIFDLFGDNSAILDRTRQGAIFYLVLTHLLRLTFR